ncbi:hypothetical protein SH501x_000835 [Pirellulaceae bacterium SH501]
MHVDVDMIETKLKRHWFQLRSGLPIALHAWPRCKKDGFCAIGQCDFTKDTDPSPIADVYVGKRYQHYMKINEMVREACERLGLKFVNMA